MKKFQLSKEDFERIVQKVKQYVNQLIQGFGLSATEKKLVWFEQTFMPAEKYSGNQSVDHMLFRKFLRYFDPSGVEERIREWIQELVAELNTLIDGKADINHTHDFNDINGLREELEIIRELINPYVEKEVLNVEEITSTSDVDDPVEGTYYFISPDNHPTGQLYLYIESAFQLQEPSNDMVYIASGDETRMFIWNGDEFQDVTGEEVDKIIYTTDLTTSLAGYTESATYTVCYKPDSSTAAKWYTLNVSVRRVAGPHRVGQPVRYYYYYEQRLLDENGWMLRKKLNSSSWTTWEEHVYSYEGHTHETSDINGLAALITESTVNKQDKTDNNLSTTNKTVVGAINEVLARAEAAYHAYTIDFQETRQIVQQRTVGGAITITKISTDNISVLKLFINGTLNTITLTNGVWTGSMAIAADTLLVWEIGRTTEGEIASINIKYNF